MLETSTKQIKFNGLGLKKCEKTFLFDVTQQLHILRDTFFKEFIVHDLSV